MSIDTKTSGLPPDILAEMQEAAERTAKGLRDPEAAKRAREDTDRPREEIYRKHGVPVHGLPAIRELRDQLNTSSTPVWPSNGSFGKPTRTRPSNSAMISTQRFMSYWLLMFSPLKLSTPSPGPSDRG